MHYLPLAGRILYASLFLMSVPGHFTRPMIQMAADHGVPLANMLVPLTGVLILLGGLSVLLGYHTKTGAWLLVLFLVPVTLTMHNFWSIQDEGMAKMQQIMFMKNVALLGAALCLAYFGPGPVSLDNRQEVAANIEHEPAVAHIT